MFRRPSSSTQDYQKGSITLGTIKKSFPRTKYKNRTNKVEPIRSSTILPVRTTFNYNTLRADSSQLLILLLVADVKQSYQTDR